MVRDRLSHIARDYWILGLAQVIHSMEETYTKLYHNLNVMMESLHHTFAWFPQVELSADGFAIANYLLIALMLGSVPAAEKGSRMGFATMWIWAIIQLCNGAFHIGTWVVLRHYFPGGISGPILFILSVMFIQRLRALSNPAPSVT